MSEDLENLTAFTDMNLREGLENFVEPFADDFDLPAARADFRARLAALLPPGIHLREDIVFAPTNSDSSYVQSVVRQAIGSISLSEVLSRHPADAEDVALECDAVEGDWAPLRPVSERPHTTPPPLYGLPTNEICAADREYEAICSAHRSSAEIESITRIALEKPKPASIVRTAATPTTWTPPSSPETPPWAPMTPPTRQHARPKRPPRWPRPLGSRASVRCSPLRCRSLTLPRRRVFRFVSERATFVFFAVPGAQF